MRVYVTGKVKGYTKQTLKEYIESKGHEMKSFTEKTDLLIVAERPGQGRLSNAQSWGIDTMSWEEFEKKHLSGETLERSLDDPSMKMRVAVTGKIQGMTTIEVKRIVKAMGYEYTTFSKTTDLLVFGSKPTAKVMLGAQYAGIKSMKWEEFVKDIDLEKVDTDYIAFDVDGRQGSSKYKIRKETGIAELKSRGFTRIDLTAVQRIPNLTRLHLDFNNLSAIDLSPLKQISNLDWLILSNNRLTSIDLSPISGSKLRVLELANNQLDEIDLSPLSSCNQLNTLILSSNRLDKIDLSPLGGCPWLESLYLSNNQLDDIDLSPINGKSLQNLFLQSNKLQSIKFPNVPRLCYLDLSMNKLTEIDTSGLAESRDLYSVNLSNNQLKTFDFTHLSNSSKIKQFLLLGNPLKSLDLTPLVKAWSTSYGGYGRTPSGPKVITKQPARTSRSGGWSLSRDILLEIDDSVVLVMDPLHKPEVDAQENLGFSNLKGRIIWMVASDLARKLYAEEGWESVKERLRKLPKTYALSSLEMPELDGLEGSIQEIINRIPNERSFDEGLSIAYSEAVSILRGQLESEVSTVGFNVELMEKTEASVLIPRILELRKIEIEKAEVVSDNNQVHLDDLHGTYYGDLLLKELKLGHRTDEEGLKKLLQAFDNLGLEIKVVSSREIEQSTLDMGDENNGG